uniref:Uncharacterized protein n=1 Tax=Dulem virus 39 TaxID=3145757 RepID=A0AAU8B8G5_9CAUD
MGPYQSFYPNNQIPMYSQGYNPMMNAQQRLAQMEQQYPQFAGQGQFQPQMQQTQQFSGLNGRIVDDFNTLSANDVPMDGNGAIFIKKDGSEIQLRNWTANGTIQTTSYKPILEPNPENGTNIPQMDLNGLYEDVRALRVEISERFDRLEKSMTNSTAKSSSSKTKKEADSE